MAEEKYSVKAILSAADKGFSSTMKSAMGYCANLKNTLTSGLGFGIMMAAGEKAFSVVTSGLGELVGEMSASSAAWKTFQGNMEMNGKTKGQIAEVKKELQDFAQATVYSSSDMASTFAQLEAVGTKNTAKLVKGFGGLAAAAENPQQAMKTLSQQATQMAAKPKVAWEDFKLMLEQTPAGISAVAKTMGKSTSSLIKDIQAGKVKTEEFLDAIAKTGTNADFTKLATEYKTVGQAVDGLQETLSNKLQPTFARVSDKGIAYVSKLSDKIDSINFDAIAGKAEALLTKAKPYWDALSTNAVEVKDAFGEAFRAIGGELKELTKSFGSTESIESFSDVVHDVAGGLKGAAGFLKEHDKIIAKVITKVPKLIVAYKGFKIAKAVAPGMFSFSRALLGLTGQGIGTLASKLLGISKSQKSVGDSSVETSGKIVESAKSFMMLGAAVFMISAGFALLALSAVSLANAGGLAIGAMVGLGVALAGMMAGMVLVLKTLAPMSAQLMPVATAMLALGAAVLIVSAGFALLALTSIQLANAGGLAIGIMVGMVATIALLAVGAAALGPALTAGALGFVAFGTAIVLVATGALLASAALAIVATVLPTVCEYGLQGALAITALGAAMLVFSVGATVAGIGCVALAAGLALVGAAVLIASAGVLLLATGALALGAGLTVCGMAVTLLAVGLPTAAAGALICAAGFTAMSPGAVMLGAALLVLTASITAFGVVLVVSTAGVVGFGLAMTASAVGVAAMAVALVAVNSNMKSIAKNAKSANKSISSMKSSVNIVNDGLDALGNKAKTAVNSLVSAFKGGAGKAKSAGKSVGNGIKTGVQNELNQLPNIANQSMSRFNTGISSGGNRAVATSRRMSNSIVSAMGTAKSGAYSSGYNIGIGLANGMAASLGRVRSIASQLAAAANAAIRAKAKIHSPSKVTDQLGQYYGQGWINGIKDKIHDAYKMAENLVTVPTLREPQLEIAGHGNITTLDEKYSYSRNATYTIIIPVDLDGKEVAKITAPYTQEELEKLQNRGKRKQGRR